MIFVMNTKDENRQKLTEADEQKLSFYKIASFFWQARWEVSEDGGGTASCVEAEGQLGRAWQLSFGSGC